MSSNPIANRGAVSATVRFYDPDNFSLAVAEPKAPRLADEKQILKDKSSDRDLIPIKTALNFKSRAWSATAVFGNLKSLW